MALEVWTLRFSTDSNTVIFIKFTRLYNLDQVQGIRFMSYTCLCIIANHLVKLVKH